MNHAITIERAFINAFYKPLIVNRSLLICVFRILFQLTKWGWISTQKHSITDRYFLLFVRKLYGNYQKSFAYTKAPLRAHVILNNAQHVWEPVLKVQYYNCRDYTFEYRICEYAPEQFTILEFWGDRDAEAVGTIYIPRTTNLIWKQWVIFILIVKHLVKKSHYFQHPQIILGYAEYDFIFNYFLQEIQNMVRPVENRDAISKGNRTILYGHFNSAGQYYPPKILHDEDCPFHGQRIARHECLYCS